MRATLVHHPGHLRARRTLRVAASFTRLVTIPVLVVGLVSLAWSHDGVPSRHHAQRTAEASYPALLPLRTCGAALCAGEARFSWHGVTAFALADLVAEGRTGDARAFLRWARSTGFTIVRVLAMLPSGWMDLSPDDGRRALPVVSAMAREEGLYVQAVALANTNEASGRYREERFLREQVRQIARLCEDAGNCVLEIANEPYHRSQAGLDDPALMARLQDEVPPGLPVAWGATEDDLSTRMAGGSFVVTHLARSGNRWARIARMADLATLAASTRKFVVDNEPIGAAEQPERDRRDSAPEAFFAQGVASRLVDAGATFHCEDCLRARVPGKVQQRCAAAFVEGRAIVPADVRTTFRGTSALPSIAQVGDGVRGTVMSATAGDRGWVLVLGEGVGGRLRWNAGWRPEARLERRTGVEVWSAAR